MGGNFRTTEQKMAWFATRAHGNVTRQELLGAGVTSRMIDRRIEKGALIPLWDGVYRVGHAAPSREAWYMGATKAGGRGTFISGRPAGHALGLVKGKAPEPELIARRELDITGLRSTRCRKLIREDTMRWKNIPITSPPRTLVDLAAVLSAEALARACHEAGVKYGTTPRQVEAVLKRKPNAVGAAKLRAIISGEQRVTLSKLERRFLQRLREAGLPLPATNVVAGTKRVDCRWPDHRLTNELNSFTFHNSRLSWEGDYQREREAPDRDDEFRRFTWTDVFEKPDHMLRQLTKLLSRPETSTRLVEKSG